MAKKNKNSSGDERPECDIALFCYTLAFNAPDSGLTRDDLRKILHEGERKAKVQNGKEILPKVSTP